MTRPRPNCRRDCIHGRTRQQGAVLYVALVMLLLLALIGIVGMQVAGLQERMAANYLNTNLAFQAAEADVRLRECYIEGMVNSTGQCSGGAAEIRPRDCGGFDPTAWAAQMSTDEPQANRVVIREIGSCNGFNSAKFDAPEPADPMYQITVYATNPAGTANAAVDTIFWP